jgi:hypothetical protein
MRAGVPLSGISELTNRPEGEVVSEFVAFFYPSKSPPQNPRNLFAACQKLYEHGKKIGFEKLSEQSGIGITAFRRLNAFFEFLTPGELTVKRLTAGKRSPKFSEPDIGAIVEMARGGHSLRAIRDKVGHRIPQIIGVIAERTHITPEQMRQQGKGVQSRKLRRAMTTMTAEQDKQAIELLGNKRLSYGAIARQIGGGVTWAQIKALDNFYEYRPSGERRRIGAESQKRTKLRKNLKIHITDRAIRQGRSTRQIIARLDRHEKEWKARRTTERTKRYLISRRRGLFNLTRARNVVNEKIKKLPGATVQEIIPKLDAVLNPFTTSQKTKLLGELGGHDPVTISNCLHFLTNPEVATKEKWDLMDQIWDGKKILLEQFIK